LKKLNSIFFLLVFCSGFAGHLIVFAIHRFQIREIVRAEIISGVPDRYLEIIQVNDDIKWEEEGKEFVLNGTYYDVIRIKVKNGKTFLYCLNDEHEEELMHKFALAVKDAADNEKRKNHKITIYSPLLHLQVSSACWAFSFGSKQQPDFYYFKSEISSCYKEIIIPPPRLLS